MASQLRTSADDFIASGSQDIDGVRRERGAVHPDSIEAWGQFIHYMGQSSLDTADLARQIEEAVSTEAFQLAAQLQKQIDELISRDAVSTSLQELDQACEEERYADATKLRDMSHSNLMGWWAGKGENDPYGHILHIEPAFGCYLGRAYLPRQLFEIKSYIDDGQIADDDIDHIVQGMGQPIMEMYLRREEDGSISSCPTALVPMPRDPAPEGQTFPHVYFEAEPEMSLPDIADLVGEMNGEARDGESAPDEQQVQEAITAIRDEVVQNLKETFQQLSSGSEDSVVDITQLNFSDMLGGAAGGNNSGIVEVSPGTLQLGDGLTVTVEVQEGPQVVPITRAAADLRKFGRDRFVIQALRDPNHAEPETEEEPQPSDTEEAREEAMHHSTVLTERLRRARFGGLDRGIAIGDPQTGTKGPEMDMWAKVAAELKRMHEAYNAGQGPRPDQDVVSEIIRNAAASIASAVVATGPTNIDLGELYSGRVTYTRIPAPQCSTDPFSGTFLAQFGPHGIECLSLSRVRDKDGVEKVVGRKITGDPNVPAGEMSFTARLDEKLDPREYAEILGVTARYAGSGLVAQPGFKQKRMVRGELLEFAESSPITHGARLGFVWAVPGQQRYLVFLNRIGLNEED